ncbi:hypothetical protein ACFXAZ_38260 [Streptomyces sp. NPDC059477]
MVDTPHLTDRARELTPDRAADRLCTPAEGGPDESGGGPSYGCG